MTYHYPDHVYQALRRHLNADRGRPVIEAITRLIAERYQQIENVLWEMRLQLDVHDATGYSLDRIGGIVGEPRRGRSDDLYRLWVTARGIVNRSGGTVDELITVLRLVLGETTTVFYQDIPDRYAEAYFTVLGFPGTVQLEHVHEILSDAAPAGVLLHVTGSPEGDVFGFSGGPGVGFDVGVFADII